MNPPPPKHTHRHHTPNTPNTYTNTHQSKHPPKSTRGEANSIFANKLAVERPHPHPQPPTPQTPADTRQQHPKKQNNHTLPPPKQTHPHLNQGGGQPQLRQQAVERRALPDRQLEGSPRGGAGGAGGGGAVERGRHPGTYLVCVCLFVCFSQYICKSMCGWVCVCIYKGLMCVCAWVWV